MSYLVFARKWRPQGFEELVGQEHVTTTLKNAIVQNRVAHAYLFSGPRGVGKTTTARIFAKALNCQSSDKPTPTPCGKCESCLEVTEGRSLDVIEIDGASNRGIDEIRQLRENARFAPSKARYKVYIIDEVHQITTDGFNALLKTLEEPPPYVKFIFATTHKHKVPATILSRCQRFDFRKISSSQLVEKLKAIAKNEKIAIEEEALFAIARASDGSVRDAESMLDQLASFSGDRIKVDDVVSILGTIEEDVLFDAARLIIDKDTAGCLELVNKFVNDGKDPFGFVNSLLGYIRNLAIAKIQKQPSGLIDLSGDTIEKIYQQSRQLDLSEILYLFNILSNVQESMHSGGFDRIYLEMAMIKLTKRDSIKNTPQRDVNLDIKPKGHSTNNGQIIENPKTITENNPKNSGFAFGAQDIKYSAEPIPIANVITLTEENLPNQNTSIATEQNLLADNNIVIAAEESPLMSSVSLGKTSDNITIDDVRRIWPDLLNRIKSEKISAALFLLEGVPSQINGIALTVNFNQQFIFYKEALERPENRILIERYLKDILGKDIRIKLAVVTEDTSRTVDSMMNSATLNKDVLTNETSNAGSKIPAVKKENGLKCPVDSTSGEERILSEPVVKAALKIFRGRVVKKQL